MHAYCLVIACLCFTYWSSCVILLVLVVVNWYCTCLFFGEYSVLVGSLLSIGLFQAVTDRPQLGDN